MATDNQTALEQLRRAREPKAKKEPKPIARTAPLPKSTKPVAKRSEKMKGVIAALKPLYDKFLAAHPDCELKTEVCIGVATCIHHVQGRGIKVILDDARWKASCGPCNSHVEANDKEAREKGNKVSRHSKNQ